MVLKMQVRKEEIIHGMFPEIIIGGKAFQMDTFIKKEVVKPPKVTRTEACIHTGEPEDVSQILLVISDNYHSLYSFPATLCNMLFCVENKGKTRWAYK